MSESRMLKAKCTKTGRYYGLELKKIRDDSCIVAYCRKVDQNV